MLTPSPQSYEEASQNNAGDEAKVPHLQCVQLGTKCRS